MDYCRIKNPYFGSKIPSLFIWWGSFLLVRLQPVRVIVDHSKHWLTLHAKGRGLFISEYSHWCVWGDYRYVEISYYIWNNELRSDRCLN